MIQQVCKPQQTALWEQHQREDINKYLGQRDSKTQNLTVPPGLKDV